jgi:UDP-N-acetylmuramoyl-L-alanyl-D-glutamate--2,6-diaminopimelate ligase
VRLGELIAGIGPAELRGDPAAEVRGIAYDSRNLRAGDLFIAWRGQRFDGHDFVPAVLAAGAAAVVVERPLAVPADLRPGQAAVLVPDARRAAGPLSAAFHGHPTARLGLVGVTGTNGKTTTTYLIREILGELGPVGLVGTVSAVVGGKPRAARLTTPEAPDLQALFADMDRAGDRYCVMEVSSMALARHRVDAAAFDLAVFTNLTPDHLSPHEHPSFLHYQQSKRRLFEAVGRPVPGAPPKDGPRGAVINADDPSGALMAAAASGAVPILRFGSGADADVRAEDVRLFASGAEFTVRYPGGAIPCRIRLSGRFNVHNALGAFGVGLLCGVPAAAIAAALDRVPGVPGRLEPVPGTQPFVVLVDYAHTPDGLENVLRAAREIAAGRVLAVFGCGGDRDRAKRPLMGEIGARLADLCWLTSDNPRSESPEAILREIEAGAARVPGARYSVAVDRRQAIGEALAAARSGDVVLIAGKGHEDYQIFADRTIHFDDREEAAAALVRLGYR